MKVTSLLAVLTLSIGITACNSKKKIAATSPSPSIETQVNLLSGNALTKTVVRNFLDVAPLKISSLSVNGEDQKIEECTADNRYDFTVDRAGVFSENIPCPENSDESALVEEGVALEPLADEDFNYELIEEGAGEDRVIILRMTDVETEEIAQFEIRAIEGARLITTLDVDTSDSETGESSTELAITVFEQAN